MVDGDTIDVLFGEKVRRVRLQGIDSPELDQPFGQQATAYLSSLIQDKEVIFFTRVMIAMADFLEKFLSMDTM